MQTESQQPLCNNTTNVKTDNIVMKLEINV